jgi:hypothetical protein
LKRISLTMRSEGGAQSSSAPKPAQLNQAKPIAKPGVKTTGLPTPAATLDDLRSKFGRKR